MGTAPLGWREGSRKPMQQLCALVQSQVSTSVVQLAGSQNEVLERLLQAQLRLHWPSSSVAQAFDPCLKHVLAETSFMINLF